MRDSEEFWQQPHGSTWVAHYAESIHDQNRRWMLEALKCVAPFTTAIDLGCHCGVLMPHLLEASPDARVVGIDISVEALREARTRYPMHTWVLASVADWLPVLADIGSHADIVVSSSCLEHIAPREIDQTLSALVRVATHAIVLQEVTVTPTLGEGKSPAGVPEWRHDYEVRLRALGWACVKKAWLNVTTDRPAAVMLFQPENVNR